jgi:hypothetical protein
MSDELLARLRAKMWVPADTQNLMDKAADEIVRLRDALRQVDRLTGEDMSSGEIVSAIIRTTEILYLGES